VIARISVRDGKKYTLMSDRSITANEMTHSNFWGKLSIAALGGGKQALLSARQKLTATGSRFHIKANSRDGQDGKRLGHDVSSSTTFRHDCTDAATAALADLRQRFCLTRCHDFAFRFVLYVLYGKVKLRSENQELYVRRSGWDAAVSNRVRISRVFSPLPVGLTSRRLELSGG
jgi:hypothetical protein